MLNMINTRRSVRKFKQDTVDPQVIKNLLEAAMNAPSAINEQAWQFVVLSGKVLDDFLKINKNTPKGAPVAVLFCQDLASETAKVSLVGRDDTEFLKTCIYARVQSMSSWHIGSTLSASSYPPTYPGENSMFPGFSIVFTCAVSA